MTLRIAFDATAIPKNRAGAGVYIFQLVRALAEVDTENRYFVFAHPEFIHEFAIRQENVEFHAVNHRSVLHRLAWEQTALPLQVKTLRIDLLHSPHYTMPCLRTARSVVTFHDMIFFLYPELHQSLRSRLFRAIMKFSARCGDRLIAVSESTRADMLRILPVAPDRIATIPEAATPAFRPLSQERTAEICRKYDLIPGRFILNVGVLEPRKNIPMLLEAFARVHKDFPDMPLVITGKKGWMFDDIFAKVTHLGLQSDVRFPGYVPEDDLVGLYNGARVFVYPSVYEGFGLPVLEAMQSGCAVITTSVSSMPEVAGDAAKLIAPNDANALAEALRQTLAEDAVVAELRRLGLERARQFSWRRCAQETLEIYRSVCQNRDTQRAIRS